MSFITIIRIISSHILYCYCYRIISSSYVDMITPFVEPLIKLLMYVRHLSIINYYGITFFQDPKVNHLAAVSNSSLNLFQTMDSTQEMPMEAPYMPVLVDDLVRTRKRRKDCFLSIGERKAIEPFKERFKSEPSRERRVTMVKSEVMVAYFNYLHSQKQTPKTPEELKEKTKVSL